jgi:hypothetical protein
LFAAPSAARHRTILEANYSTLVGVASGVLGSQFLGGAFQIFLDFEICLRLFP